MKVGLIEKFIISKGVIGHLFWTGKEYAVKIPKISKYYIEFGDKGYKAKRKAIEYYKRRKKYIK